MEATAKYDFHATADDELSFRKGECLKVKIMNTHTMRNIHTKILNNLMHTRAVINSS